MPIEPILYADDDENDVFLMERAFRRLQIPNPLQVVPDGKLAIHYLAGTGPYAKPDSHPVPCLTLLDLSMPGRHGLDVLQWIRSTSAHRSLPVIVFSSSNQQSDVNRAYLLGASGYLLKPGDPDDLLEILRRVQAFWLAPERPPGTFIDFAAGLLVRPPPSLGVWAGGRASTALHRPEVSRSVARCPIRRGAQGPLPGSDRERAGESEMGMDLLPPGEGKRRAIRWITAERAAGSPHNDLQLVEEASRHFQLGAAEEEFLFRHLRERVEQPQATRSRAPRPR